MTIISGPTPDELSDAVQGHYEPWDEFDEPPPKPGTARESVVAGFRLLWAFLPVVLTMFLVDDVRVAVDAHRDGGIGGIVIFALLVVTVVNAASAMVGISESYEDRV